MGERGIVNIVDEDLVMLTIIVNDFSEPRSAFFIGVLATVG